MLLGSPATLLRVNGGDGHGIGIIRQTLSSVSGVEVEAVPVLGASEHGIDGSRAILT
jgi:hypothetical protein